MTTEPEGSPSPYSDAQLTKLASHLGLLSTDPDARFLVGIAREFKEQKSDLSDRRKARRETTRQEAEDAADAAKYLEKLVRLYRKKSLPTALADIARGPDLGRILNDGAADHIIQRLREKAKVAPAKRGHKSHDHETAALLSLIALWEDRTGRKEVSHRYIEDALQPLGYSPGEKQLSKKIAEARRYLNPKAAPGTT